MQYAMQQCIVHSFALPCSTSTWAAVSALHSLAYCKGQGTCLIMMFTSSCCCRPYQPCDADSQQHLLTTNVVEVWIIIIINIC